MDAREFWTNDRVVVGTRIDSKNIFVEHYGQTLRVHPRALRNMIDLLQRQEAKMLAPEPKPEPVVPYMWLGADANRSMARPICFPRF